MLTAIDKNTALVLIDLQKGILNLPTVHPIKDVLANAALLVSAFRAKGLPVVPVNVNSSLSPLARARVEMRIAQLGPDGKPIQRPADFADIVPEIKTEPTDIFITKRTWGAFSYTSLHEELQKRNVTQIVLCGVATSFGVESTARFASELGYNITFAIDAMTDRVLEAHNNSIKNIFPRIGELSSTQDVIRMLNC
jgi:nicotinamidase-related amidase